MEHRGKTDVLTQGRIACEGISSGTGTDARVSDAFDDVAQVDGSGAVLSVDFLEVAGALAGSVPFAGCMP